VLACLHGQQSNGPRHTLDHHRIPPALTPACLPPPDGPSPCASPPCSPSRSRYVTGRLMQPQRPDDACCWPRPIGRLKPGLNASASAGSPDRRRLYRLPALLRFRRASWRALPAFHSLIVFSPCSGHVPPARGIGALRCGHPCWRPAGFVLAAQQRSARRLATNERQQASCRPLERIVPEANPGAGTGRWRVSKANFTDPETGARLLSPPR